MLLWLVIPFELSVLLNLVFLPHSAGQAQATTTSPAHPIMPKPALIINGEVLPKPVPAQSCPVRDASGQTDFLKQKLVETQPNPAVANSQGWGSHTGAKQPCRGRAALTFPGLVVDADGLCLVVAVVVLHAHQV